MTRASGRTAGLAWATLDTMRKHRVRRMRALGRHTCPRCGRARRPTRSGASAPDQREHGTDSARGAA